MLFLGEYEYKVDAKGRIPIPPKFRKEFKEGIILNMGPDEQINGYTSDEWEKNADTFDFGPIAQSKKRQMTRAFFGSAFDLELDGQGRVMLPPPLRQYAGIKESVVIAGMNKNIEVWSKERWQKAISEARAKLHQHYESTEIRE
jgi:MraZ protein